MSDHSIWDLRSYVEKTLSIKTVHSVSKLATLREAITTAKITYNVGKQLTHPVSLCHERALYS